MKLFIGKEHYHITLLIKLLLIKRNDASKQD